MSEPFPSSSTSSSSSASTSSSSSSPPIGTSSSSSNGSASSSSSSTDPCGGIRCEWKLTASGPEAQSGCGPNCRCPEPTGLKRPLPNEKLAFDIVYTDCVPREPLSYPSSSSSSSSTSSSQGGGSSSSSTALRLQFPPQIAAPAFSVDTVLIDVPNVATGVFSQFSVQVRNGFHIFRGLGWTVTLVKLPSPRTDSSVLPATIPASAPSSGGMLAGVTFLEATGSCQYWVPVLESHLGAALHAREWTVVFHKAPRP